MKALLAALLLFTLHTRAGEAPSAREFTTGQAVILGVVEGVTEYLPVSSTGHLLLTQHAMGMAGTPEKKQAADAYAMVIQFGAIVAVIGLFWRRIRGMILGLLGKDRDGLRLAVNLVVALVPALIAGLLINKWVRAHLFGMWPVVSAWGIGGLAILLVERRLGATREEGGDLSSISPATAFGIGCFQCLAMWPGVSRSLCTMLGGRLLGLNLRASVEFSFLLGGLTLTAAAAKDALDNGREIVAMFGPGFILTGLVAAFLSAVVAVRWLVAYLGRHSLAVFGWYRIVLALVVGALLLTGRLAG